MKTVPSVPAGFHTVTPYLTVAGIPALIDFLKQVFAAEEIERMLRPDGAVGHAELRIGDSRIMLGEAPEPAKIKPGSLYVYVDDVDAVYAKALAAGATSLSEPQDQFYGDRGGGVLDASGNTWWIATHFENVSPEELQRRAAAR